MFANFNFFNYGKHFGGSHNFSKLIADVAFYKKLNPKLILATQIFNAFAIGDKIPFQQLPQIGGPKAMRGYYQGRYTDKHLSLWQTELRFPIYKRFGLATFGNAAILGNEKSILRTNDIKYSYGAGLRFTFNRKEHLNLRMDYALGKDKNFFYITVGEAF
jgi:hemolysin activation/secretion protein